MKNTYDRSIQIVTELCSSVKDTGGKDDISSFLRIREEMNRFLVSLYHSNNADGTGQQIHFLFVAMSHLDNIEEEILVSFRNDELLRLGKIQDKIGGLKILILNFIKHLISEN